MYIHLLYSTLNPKSEMILVPGTSDRGCSAYALTNQCKEQILLNCHHVDAGQT